MIKKYFLSVNDFKSGDHLCHIYENEEDRLVVTEEFFRQGFERNEKVLLLTSSPVENKTLNYLLSRDLGIERYMAAGKFKVLPHQSKGNTSNTPDSLFNLIDQEAGSKPEGNFSGLRIIIEMGWMLQNIPDPEKFIAFINQFDENYSAQKPITICQLDRNQIDPGLMMDLVMIHPIVIVGRETFNNFYYISPANIKGQNLPEARLNEWINNLFDFKRAAEELFFTRFWVESASDFIFWIKADGSFQYANQAACQELGYSLDELLNIKVEDIDSLYASGEWRNLWKDLKKKGVVFFETHHRTKSGRLIPVEIKANYLKYNNREYVCAIARDISGRRQVEAALKESQVKTKALLDAIPDLMFLYSSDGVFLDYYAADPSLLLLPPKKFLGRNIGDIFPPDFTKTVMKLAKKALKTGEMQIHEYPIELSGQTHYFEARITACGSDNFLTISRDITDRKMAEKKLRESREKYRMVAEFTYDWEYWIDPDGKYIYISPSCERITGYPYDAFISKPDLLLQIVHPEDQHMVLQHDKEMKSGQQLCQFDFRIITRQGEERWVSHCCQPVYSEDGHCLGQRGSNRDITDRKRAEEALCQSEEAFRLLVEGVTDYAFFMLDPKGKIASWNAGAERLSGYSIKEALGQDLSIFYSGVERARNRPQFELSMAAKKGHYEQEGWRIRKDGSKFWANVVTTALYDKEGRLTSFARITRDITARKLEQEMQKLSKPSALSDY
jgi:PAS domain S-box-containing protein